MWTINLIYVITGALLGFLSSIGMRKYDERRLKKRLKRMIREDFDHILFGMKSGEKEKIERWGNALENPNISIRATSYQPRPAIIEGLKEELFLFDDPIPGKILSIGRFMKFYRELHGELVQMCTDITQGCQSFEECTIKLKSQWFKDEFLKPKVQEINEVRNLIIATIESAIEHF